VKFYTIIMFFIAFLIIGCGSEENTETKKNKIKSIDKHHIDKSIAYLTNHSETITISKNKIQTNICQTKTIILNIFAVWSKPSLGELEVLDKLQKRKKNVCVISIAIDSDSNTSLANEYKISHKVIFNSQNNNFVDKIANIIHINKNFKLPMSIIYKNNQYIDNYQGLMPFEMLDYIIKDK